MQPIPMVRATALAPFVDFLERAGSPVERLLADVGLSAPADPERLLPLHQCLAFLDHSARKEGAPDLGLLVGLETPFAALGAFARLIRGAPTVQQTLDRLVAASALHNSGDRLWLARNGRQAMLCHRFALRGAPGQRQGQLFTATMMIDAIRSIMGPQWAANEIRLPAGEAPFRARHEARLGVPVVCSGDTTAVVFSTSLLAARPVGDGAPSADDYRFLIATAPARDFAGSIRQAIGSLLAGGYPDIRSTAEAVGLSVRTLQRHLAASGESYSQLVEAVRLETCIDLMRNQDVRLVDIAAELGYSDPGNFSRAFRRWTGTTPRAFRRAET